MKKQKGITLIALIITIIVLLILAVVAIGAVNNGGIIQHAQNAVDRYKEGAEKENAALQSYLDYLNKYGTQNGVSGNDGPGNGGGSDPIEPEISLSSTTLTITIGKNKPLTATVTGIENSEITWSVEDENVATLSSTTGNSVTVTAEAEGTTTITATCGDYSATCTVIVNSVSIKGETFGNMTYNYYVTINDNGTGVVALGNGSPVGFNYELTNNIITTDLYTDLDDDGEREQIICRIDEEVDSNGNINKILCIGAVTEPYWNNISNEELAQKLKNETVSYYYMIMTTNGTVGLSRYNNENCYYRFNGENLQVSFSSERVSAYRADGSLEYEWINYFKYENIVYVEEVENVYSRLFIIWDGYDEIGQFGS